MKYETKARVLTGLMTGHCVLVTAGFLGCGLRADAAAEIRPEPPVIAAQGLRMPGEGGFPWTVDDVAALARMLYGEARGCDETQQAACVWCVLNRVDDARYPDTILGVLEQPGQFCGYNGDNPVLPDLFLLAEDVLLRWSTGGDGRVLPAEYLYFSGDGSTTNTFRTALAGGEIWDWALPSPYGTEETI